MKSYEQFHSRTITKSDLSEIRKRGASSKSNVDYLEIRVEQSEATSLSFRGPQLDGVDRSFALSEGIRACDRRKFFSYLL